MSAAVPVSEKRLLSVPEACARVGLPRSRMYVELAAGRIFSVKVGRSRRVPAQALEAFVARLIAEQGQGQPPAA